MDDIPWATLLALETYETTGDADLAMRLFRENGGMNS